VLEGLAGEVLPTPIEPSPADDPAVSGWHVANELADVFRERLDKSAPGHVVGAVGILHHLRVDGSVVGVVLVLGQLVVVEVPVVLIEVFPVEVLVVVEGEAMLIGQVVYELVHHAAPSKMEHGR
jgi:hypothetical protein